MKYPQAKNGISEFLRNLIHMAVSTGLIICTTTVLKQFTFKFVMNEQKY